MFRYSILVALFVLVTSSVDAQWTNLGGRVAVDVAADDSAVYEVKSDYRVYRNAGSGFRALGGGGRVFHIDVGRGGVYGIGQYNRIYRHTGSGWQELNGNGRGIDVAVDGRGTVWAIGNDYRVYYYTGSQWIKVRNSVTARRISASPSGVPFVVGTDNKLYRGNGNGFTRVSDLSVVDVAVDRYSRPFVTTLSGARIGYMSGSRFVEMPGSGKGSKIAVNSSYVFVKGTDSNIYRQALANSNGNGNTPPRSANRPPRAPTALGNNNNARVSFQASRPNISLRWRDNGDPDGDRVTFWVNLYRWDGRQWVSMYNGNANTIGYTFRASAGTYYAWRVYAMDANKRSNPWYAATGWQRFSTR